MAALPAPPQAALDEAASADTPPERLDELATDPALAPAVAENRAAPEALMRRLVVSGGPFVRRALAANPAAPPDVLLGLSREHPDRVARNPALPLWFLEGPRRFAELSHYLLAPLVAQPACPRGILKWAAGHPEENVLLGLAGNAAAPASVLERLASHGSAHVREAVALHRRHDPITDEAEALRTCAILRAGHGAEEVVRMIDDGLLVRWLKPGMGRWAKDRCWDPDEVVDARVQTQRRWRVLSAVASARTPPRTLGMAHPWAPTIALERGATSIWWVERLAVAHNPQLPDALRATLAADGNVLVARAAAIDEPS